jgi:hypothetical protein
MFSTLLDAYFVLATVSLKVKTPPKPPENGLEAVNASVLESNGKSELLNATPSDNVVRQGPLQTNVLNSIIFLLLSRIYLA